MSVFQRRKQSGVHTPLAHSANSPHATDTGFSRVCMHGELHLKLIPSQFAQPFTWNSLQVPALHRRRRPSCRRRTRVASGSQRRSRRGGRKGNLKQQLRTPQTVKSQLLVKSFWHTCVSRTDPTTFSWWAAGSLLGSNQQKPYMQLFTLFIRYLITWGGVLRNRISSVCLNS